MAILVLISTIIIIDTIMADKIEVSYEQYNEDFNDSTLLSGITISGGEIVDGVYYLPCNTYYEDLNYRRSISPIKLTSDKWVRGYITTKVSTFANTNTDVFYDIGFVIGNLSFVVEIRNLSVGNRILVYSGQQAILDETTSPTQNLFLSLSYNASKVSLFVGYSDPNGTRKDYRYTAMMNYKSAPQLWLGLFSPNPESCEGHYMGVDYIAWGTTMSRIQTHTTQFTTFSNHYMLMLILSVIIFFTDWGWYLLRRK